MAVAKKRSINQENEIKPSKFIKVEKVVQEEEDDDENEQVESDSGNQNISLNNDSDENQSDLEQQDDSGDDSGDDNGSDNQVEEEEEEEEEDQKLLKKLNNEQILANRFISTMADSFSKTLQNKKTHIGALRGLYFESINQIKHETIRELLFKPKSWHMFYKLVKKSIGVVSKSKDEDEISGKDQEDEEDEEEEEDQDEKELDNGSDSDQDTDNFTEQVFNNLLSYNIIGGKESLIIQIKKQCEMNHLYRQSIALSSQEKYSNIVESFFINKISGDNNSIYDLLDQYVMFLFTLEQIPINYLNILITILSSIKEENILLVNFEKVYKSLRKFLSVSSTLLNKIIKENVSTSTTATTTKSSNEITDPSIIKFLIQLSGYLFKFSLLNNNSSNSTSTSTYESDYSIVKLLLGKSNYLAKLVSMLTSFDFSQSQYLPKQQSSNSFISLFLNQFIQESKLNPPPSNPISYLKSRILCERGIIVLTKLKDPLLTKLKISSATLPVPEQLLAFIKDNSSLLVKIHKNMDDTQAIRQLKLDSLLNILVKYEEYLVQKEKEQEEQEKEEDYIKDHFSIDKSGNNEAAAIDDDEDNEKAQRDLDDSVSENQPKSLLDFIDEDDLKSDSDQDE